MGGPKRIRHLVCRILFGSDSNTKGFEQGGSEAEENSPVDCFRRRGNERSEAIGAGAPGQNPFGRAKKPRSLNEVFSFMSAGHNFIMSEASTSFDSLLSTSLSEKRT